jgi:hypothetical protein
VEIEDAQELTLIYIAKRLKEALALEQVLENAGVEYDVRPDTYRGGIIFVSERVGAFFYVSPHDVERAHAVMREHQFKPQRH